MRPVLKQFGASVMVLAILFLLLSAPRTEPHESSVTTTEETVSTTYTTRSWQVTDCGNSQCPVIQKSSAVLIGHSSIALDITVFNPTSLPVHNLDVLFSYWGPYACPGCPPDYTTVIRFDAVPSGATQSKHVEMLNTQWFRQSMFRYTFHIETWNFVSLSVFLATSYSTTTHVYTSTSSLAFYQAIRPPVPLNSIELLGAIELFGFLGTMMLSSVVISIRRTKTRIPTKDKRASVTIALDPQFRSYRDRLQESLFEGKIDETTYTKLLAEFRKSKK
jgi:hypothetical protein